MIQAGNGQFSNRLGIIPIRAIFCTVLKYRCLHSWWYWKISEAVVGGFVSYSSLIVTRFGVFGFLWPPRSKSVGAGSPLFVSFLVFLDVLMLRGSPINDKQMRFSPFFWDWFVNITIIITDCSNFCNNVIFHYNLYMLFDRIGQICYIQLPGIMWKRYQVFLMIYVGNISCCPIIICKKYIPLFHRILEL